MKHLRTIISTILLFTALAGIGYALTPPPVNQNIGLYDTSVDKLVTNATDQIACRACHQTNNIIGRYDNTVGGVPTRHHNMLSEGVINPLTNTPFTCKDCHPSTGGNGILLDRSCLDCHNGTDFYANSIGAHVGNFSRPHHANTTYASSNIGNPVANRVCNICHGSLVDNYNDGHYQPGYNTSFNVTPYATYKITNFSQPDGLGGFKTWGGCESCHLANPSTTPFPIGDNYNNHHIAILGLMVNNSTPFQNATTPGATCSWCHVIDKTNSTGNGPTYPLFLNLTNPLTNETQIGAAEVRNSTIEMGDNLEPGTNISINGTGCEKCHGVSSLHNIQFNYASTQGFGHINNISDCSGCHNSWLPATDFVPGGLIPTMDSINPSVIVAGNVATLIITGANFLHNSLTFVVTVDGVSYTPTSITDSQIVVNIPALIAGTHKLQLVKGGNILSKLATLTVVPNTAIASAKLKSGTITITGTGFGTIRPPNAQLYISINHAGSQITSANIISWSDTQIKAKNSAAAIGDVVTVMTANSGEAQAVIK